MRKIAIASEHAGYDLKELIKAHLLETGFEAVDLGAENDTPIDYPDIAVGLGLKVAAGEFERGILICGTGVGVSLAAGKVPGIRAALCSNSYMAEMCVRHNDANILCLGSWVTGSRTCIDMVDRYLAAKFEGGRHERRIARIAELERELHRDG